MEQQDAPQAISPEEDARIGATSATFANKVYLTSLGTGAKTTFAKTRRVGGKEEESPRVAMFLQRADLRGLHRLLVAAVDADAAPEQRTTPSRAVNGRSVPERRKAIVRVHRSLVRSTRRHFEATGCPARPQRPFGSVVRTQFHRRMHMRTEDIVNER